MFPNKFVVLTVIALKMLALNLRETTIARPDWVKLNRLIIGVGLHRAIMY